MSDDTRYTRKGLATRARIVDATAALMFEHGVESTTLEEVREAAGVSGSQMSHYFRGKDDLTREVVDARKTQVLQFHTDPKFGGFDSIASLKTWAEACVADVESVYLKGGCVYGSLAGELIEGDEQIRDAVTSGYDAWIELFRAGLTAMKKRGELRADADPRHLAVSLVVAHQGGTMLTFVTGDPEPLRANMSAAVAYVESFAPKVALDKMGELAQNYGLNDPIPE